MSKRSHYKKTVGYYFFSIKMGYNNTITISRQNKKDAEYAFSNYLKQKKDCEWLGQWDGKKYIDNVFKNPAA